MTLPDNDPAKWFYSEHTAVKHQILDGYLNTWISIRGSTSAELGYIDGFAGRGIYENGSVGSPILAMKIAQNKINNINRNPNGMKKFRCYFVEKNEENYLCLKEHVDKLSPTCKDVIPLVRKGTFEETATEFIELSKNSSTIPTLFFIDPFGWDGVPFDVIKGILDNPYTEILFTFMVYDINRFLTSTSHQISLNKLYGSPIWEDCKNSEDREGCLVNLYLNLIKGATKAQYVLPFQMSDSDIKRTKYYLIFVTHHPRGIRKMKDIMKGVSSGNFGFAGPDHENLVIQGKLPVVEDMQIKWILKNYTGKTTSFGNFLKEVYPLTDEKYIGSLIETDYRALIKKIEQNGNVTISRSNPKSRAYDDQMILTFH